MLALAHGTNDAQKTMGVITLALIANGNLSSDSEVPTWVVICAASAISLGTYFGGWRIIRTMGTRIIKMDAAQGFCAQGAGAAVILASSHYGFPLSTTQVISGGVMGAGAGKKVSAVRWGVAGNIVVAWLLTLPAAAAIGRRDLRVLPAVRKWRGWPDCDLRTRDRRDGAGLRPPAAAGAAAGLGGSDDCHRRRDQGPPGHRHRVDGRGHRHHRRLRDPDLRSDALGGDGRATSGRCSPPRPAASPFWPSSS